MVVKLVISDLLAKFNDLLSQTPLLILTPDHESPKCVDISLTILTHIPFLYFLEKRTKEQLKLKFEGLSKNPQARFLILSISSFLLLSNTQQCLGAQTAAGAGSGKEEKI